MAVNDERLAEIRGQLDAIDVELHTLLMRRAMLAPEVIHAKGGLGPFWRPAREAQILRRRLAEHQGHFPAAAIAKIWCEIICGMISMETHFRLAAWAPDGNARIPELARDYFGQVVPVTREANSAAAIFAAASDHDIAAVLPWPDKDSDPWWVHLAQHRMPVLSIVWRLPFVAAEDGQPAALVSRIPLEPTGDDRTLVAVQGTKPAGGTAIAQSGDWHLVELDGFFRSGEEVATALHSGSATAVVIGAYAVPIRIDRAHPTELRKTHP